MEYALKYTVLEVNKLMNVDLLLSCRYSALRLVIVHPRKHGICSKIYRIRGKQAYECSLTSIFADICALRLVIVHPRKHGICSKIYRIRGKTNMNVDLLLSCRYSALRLVIVHPRKHGICSKIYRIRGKQAYECSLTSILQI
ncbi:hypothetical protein CDAR_238651 [Caerostris darwini]|uniref:Uncharacterized protein n=1 Tax=Caerostris darwini TaxID=1538125 RepID=A0AAV4TFN5_9ARAC|nr:hypothetical protein CDAR_238651 [Caerostris darwini]